MAAQAKEAEKDPSKTNGSREGMPRIVIHSVHSDGDGESRNQSKTSADSGASGISASRSPTSLSRKSRLLLSSCAAFSSAIQGRSDEVLQEAKSLREKDPQTRDLIVASIRRNRFCRMLEDAEVEAILEAMECYEFKSGAPIVQQGEVSNRFFVTQEGVLEVFVDGSVANTMHQGDAFGAIGLLYDCPRTATVIAKEDSVVWGAAGNVFRKVLRAHGDKSYAENQDFFNRMRIFDGLSPKQKECIGKIAVVTAAYDAGSRIADEGCDATAIYFVKSGELTLLKGATIDASGKLRGGIKHSQLSASGCFGEAAALSGGKYEFTLQARTDCRLICVSVAGLKEVLGPDLATCLQHLFIVSVLQKSPVMGHLSLSHRLKLAEAMQTKAYDPKQTIEDGLRLIVVIHGQIAGTQQGKTVGFSRGQWYEDEAFVQVEHNDKSRQGEAKAKESVLVGLSAGSTGATIAVLTKAALATALKTFGLSAIGGADHAMDYMRKMLLTKTVPILRELSQDKVDAMIRSFVVERYTHGAEVIQQGEIGSALYIVASGELSIFADGVCIVKAIGKAGILGEREILFDEPRIATVRVVSDEAELWSVDRSTFLEFITGQLREKLMQRIRLQDRRVTIQSLKHVRKIGAGSFGSVRLVQHTRTSLRYALKRIRKVEGEVPAPVKTECDLLAEIDHPFVLMLVKTFETVGSIYILTELVTGGSLYDHMHKMGILSRAQGQFYVASLVLILEALHDMHIVYRDLKPENVMLDQHGYLKLIDFGLAKRFTGGSDVHGGNRTFTVAGTIYYIAPEVLRGHGYGTEADIWSLGVLFYELVCGRLPFGEEEAEQFEIAAAVLEGKLKFPRRYTDKDGKTLIKGLLCTIPQQRVGMGIKGWEDIKCAEYFKTGVSGNLFSHILGHEIVPPVVPECEQYGEAGTTDTGCLSDDEELGGDAEYVVDNSLLKAPTAGLVFRFSKRLDDRDTSPETEQPVWGSTVVGRALGDDWLRVGQRYLPMAVNGLPVLTLKMYLVDNRCLKAPTAGLIYRCSKRLDDRDTSAATQHPAWGSTVSGLMDESDEWLMVGDRYLPVRIGTIQVLTPTTASAADAAAVAAAFTSSEQHVGVKTTPDSSTKKKDQLRSTFSYWDKEGKGTISKEQLSYVLSKKGLVGPELNSVFAIIDRNGDGLIDYQELVSWLYK